MLGLGVALGLAVIVKVGLTVTVPVALSVGDGVGVLLLLGLALGLALKVGEMVDVNVGLDTPDPMVVPQLALAWVEKPKALSTTEAVFVKLKGGVCDWLLSTWTCRATVIDWPAARLKGPILTWPMPRPCRQESLEP